MAQVEISNVVNILNIKCVSVVPCYNDVSSNIWTSIHEKVKQHWGWVEKKCCL